MCRGSGVIHAERFAVCGFTVTGQEVKGVVLVVSGVAVRHVTSKIGHNKSCRWYFVDSMVAGLGAKLSGRLHVRCVHGIAPRYLQTYSSDLSSCKWCSASAGIAVPMRDGNKKPVLVSASHVCFASVVAEVEVALYYVPAREGDYRIIAHRGWLEVMLGLVSLWVVLCVHVYIYM